MNKSILLALMVSLCSQAQAQSRGVVVPVPDAIARGLAVVGALSGQQLVVPLQDLRGPVFGASGQYVLGGASGLLLAGRHRALGDARDNTLAVDLRLWTGRFVFHNMFLGVQGGYAQEISDDAGKPAVGHLGPMAGYNMTIHEHASLMPSLGATYDTWIGPRASGVRHHTVSLGLDVTFIMQLSHHLALSMGPFVKQSVYHHVQAVAQDTASSGLDAGASWDTTYGVKAGLLGWM